MYHGGIRILLLFRPRPDLVRRRSFTHASLRDVAFHRDPRVINGSDLAASKSVSPLVLYCLEFHKRRLIPRDSAEICCHGLDPRFIPLFSARRLLSERDNSRTRVYYSLIYYNDNTRAHARAENHNFHASFSHIAIQVSYIPYRVANLRL